MERWQLFGDVNMLSYGGKLIRRDEEIEGAYEVFEVMTGWATGDIPDGHVWAFLYTVYPDDSWIKQDDVLESAGLYGEDYDDYEYVDAIASYYGNDEFNPEYYVYDKEITVSQCAEWMRQLDAEEWAQTA